MSVEQFVENLKENKIEDAIQSMHEEIRARVATSITESRESILENLGFALNEEQMNESITGDLIDKFDDGKDKLITNGKGRELLLKFAKKYFDYEEWDDLVSVDEDTAEDIVDEIIVSLNRKKLNSMAVKELEKISVYAR